MIPWVVAGRYLRDRLISLWNLMTGARSYQAVKKDTADHGRDPSMFIFSASGIPSSPMACRSTSLLRRSTMGLADEIPRRFLVTQCAVRSARSESRRRAQNFPSDSLERIKAQGHKRNKRAWAGWSRSGSLARIPMSAAAIPTTASRYVPLCWMIARSRR